MCVKLIEETLMLCYITKIARSITPDTVSVKMSERERLFLVML